MERSEEFESHGPEVQKAILHILDGKRRSTVMSEETLDLEEPEIMRYVRRFVSKCRNDMRLKPGVFREDSPFRNELDRYFKDKTDLPLFSSSVLKECAEYFEQEEACSYDVLFADCRIDDVPYMFIIFLEAQDAHTHLSDVSEGAVRNTIVTAGNVMPAVSKRISTFAFINMLSEEIFSADEVSWKNGISVLNDKVLYAEAGISKKEVVETVREITLEVAAECHEDPVLLLGKVKNHIAGSVSEGLPVSPRIIASEVFEDEGQSELFLKKAEEKRLPERTELPKASAGRTMKTQRISTDTGIEIAFPAAYTNNKQYIDFIRHPDGTISIEIKQVGKIINR